MRFDPPPSLRALADGLPDKHGRVTQDPEKIKTIAQLEKWLQHMTENVKRLNDVYFEEGEYVDDGGSNNAGKPVKLNSNGQVAAAMINDADIDHGSTGGLSDDDHSQYHCFSDDTEILTVSDGWVTNDCLTPGQSVYTLNLESGKVEPNTIEDIFRYSSYSEMYQVKSRNIDLLLTPDHGIVYKHRRKFANRLESSDKWLTGPISKVSTLSRISIPVASQLIATDRNDPFYELYGWFVGDGSIVNNTIVLWQNRGEKLDRIKHLLDSLGLSYSENVNANSGRSFIDTNGNEYTSHADYCYLYVSTNSYRDSKYRLKKDLKELLHDDELDFPSFLRGLIDSDGHRYSSNSSVVYSKNIDVLNDLQTLCVKFGYRASVRYHVNNVYRCNIAASNQLILQKKHFTKIAYSGGAWCAKVANRTLIVRRNGFAVIVHNTDARGDARYFRENEHINVTTGVSDAGKPIILGADGLLSGTFMAKSWPIGSVFVSVVSTNPATLLGFGTWVAVGAGKTLVGLDATDTDFDAAEETGGAKTHLHAVDVGNTTSGAPSATTVVQSGAGATVASSTHTHDVDPASVNSVSGSNVMPYYVVYLWKRTA